MHRPVSATTLFAACLVLFGFGCSEEPPAHFEPGKYATTHRTAIEDDCDKRVICAQRTNDFLRPDAFDHCVTTRATDLNRNPVVDPVTTMDLQLKFELGLVRCGTQPDACNYVACADSMFTSAGQEQLPKIDYICAQKRQCGIDTASLAVSPDAFFDACQVQTVVALDAAATEVRTSYQAQYYACMAQISCAFQTCFGF